MIELVVEYAQRIVHVTTIANVTPCQTQAEVKIAYAFVADKILAGEQAGTTNVSRTQRHLRYPVCFFEQTYFGVDSLVFITLVTAQGRRTIVAVGDSGIAERPFQPIKRLKRHAVTTVRIGTVSVQ
ncbi:hypothetical protein D3C85_1156630 [compost metagenome]